MWHHLRKFVKHSNNVLLCCGHIVSNCQICLPAFSITWWPWEALWTSSANCLAPGFSWVHLIEDTSRLLWGGREEGWVLTLLTLPDAYPLPPCQAADLQRLHLFFEGCCQVAGLSRSVAGTSVSPSQPRHDNDSLQLPSPRWFTIPSWAPLS